MSPEFRENPQHQDDKLPDPEFGSDESLYRRFNPQQHLIEGVLSPLAFQFPRQSFNRGKYSKPEHVLHPDCCDGKELAGWLVATLLVGEVPEQKETGDGRTFRFFLRHTPKEYCYSHSEIWCNLHTSSSDEYSQPPKTVREYLRAELARKARYQN